MTPNEVKLKSGYLNFDKMRNQISLHPIYYFFLLSAIFIILLKVIVNPLQINHDSALYIQSGELILEGKMPYVDFIDINPPLIMYLSTIPVAIANFLHVNPAIIFNILVLTLSFWSIFMIKHILVRSKLNISMNDVDAMQIAWCAFILYLYFFTYDFGQREQLMILVFIPYLLVRWVTVERGEESTFTTVSVGILNAIFMCLKPHYFLLLIVTEIYWFYVRRSFSIFKRPEIYSFCFILLLYGLHFLFLPDEVTRNFFYKWLPYIMANYDVYRLSLSEIFSMYYRFIFAVILLSLATIFVKNSRFSLSTLRLPMAAVALVSLLIFFLQGKGWTYHEIPALGASFLMCGILFRELMQYKSWDLNISNLTGQWHLKAILSAYIATYLVLMIAYGIVHVMHAKTHIWSIEETIEKYSKMNDPVLFISTTTTPGYPLLVMMDRKSASRYLWSFQIPMFYKESKDEKSDPFPYHHLNKMPLEEKEYLSNLVKDIHENKPPLIFIHDKKGCMACSETFNIFEYLKSEGVIKEIEMSYQPLNKVKDFQVFIPKQGKKDGA